MYFKEEAGLGGLQGFTIGKARKGNDQTTGEYVGPGAYTLEDGNF